MSQNSLHQHWAIPIQAEQHPLSNQLQLTGFAQHWGLRILMVTSVYNRSDCGRFPVSTIMFMSASCDSLHYKAKELSMVSWTGESMNQIGQAVPELWSSRFCLPSAYIIMQTGSLYSGKWCIHGMQKLTLSKAHCSQHKILYSWLFMWPICLCIRPPEPKCLWLFTNALKWKGNILHQSCIRWNG